MINKLLRLKTQALIILLIILLLLPAISGCRSEEDGGPVLLVYVAAGVREVMETIAAAYSTQHPENRVKLKFVYNNSGRLLAQIELSGEGDLFISSDDLYMEKARSRKLVAEWSGAALFIPAIVVPRGNPEGINGLIDLARPGLEIVLTEESAAMGRAAEQIMLKNNLFDEITENVIARVATAPQVALSIALGQGDAGITGRNSAGEMSDKVEIIAIPPEQNVYTNIAVGILKSSAYPEQARDFLQFIISPAGQAIFEAYGFGPMEDK